MCLCAAKLKFWIQTDLGCENSSSYYRKGRPVAFNFSQWSRIGHALRPIFMLRLVKIRQVSSCRKFMQHLETCFLWQLKLTEFSFLWMYNMKFGNFLLGFCLRNTSLVKVGNPIADGIVFRYSPYLMRIRGLKKYEAILAYLIALRSCISNGKTWIIILFDVWFFLIEFNEVERSLWTFVRFETMK